MSLTLVAATGRAKLNHSTGRRANLATYKFRRLYSKLGRVATPAAAEEQRRVLVSGIVVVHSSALLSRRDHATMSAWIIHEREKWDRHLACLSCLTGWKPIPQGDE